MAPEVLRNIVTVLGVFDAITLIEPDAEIDQATHEGAERPVRIAGPDDLGTTRRAGQTMHRERILPSADKACQLTDFSDAWTAFLVDSADVVA
jgi:hypothetical protein